MQNNTFFKLHYLILVVYNQIIIYFTGAINVMLI